jgi:hypothetical protein
MDGDSPTLGEALKGPDGDEWRKVTAVEIDKLEERRTWEYVDRPHDANILPCSFVLRRKHDEHNKIKSYKARLVTSGHRQVYNVDYTETTAPTMTLTSLRFLLALAAKYDLEAENIDFSSTYINADIEETIYMEQPPGFKKPGHEHQVCLLRKALYGLKQAGRQWYKKLCELLVDRMGLTRCAADPAVLYLFDGDLGVIIGIHVDDSFILTNSKAACTAVKREIGAHYEITDLGPVRWLLGFEIRRDRAARRITMSQSAYIDTLAERFHLTQARSRTVPLSPHVDLYASAEAVDAGPYAQLTGSLMYTAIGTCPDVAYPVSLLARFMSAPTHIHLDAAEDVLRYLISTKSLVLTFGLDDTGLTAHSDSDHASQPD